MLVVAATLCLRPPAPVFSQGLPSQGYDASITLIRRRQASDDAIGDPRARSILLTHGSRSARAIVLFHGLTDSPRQFETLAHLLHDAGDNVYVPRLPHHGLRGGDARALAALTAEELRQSADSAVEIANGLGDSVIVVGLSLGGTMAAWVAQNRRVWRSVLIAPALQPGRIPSILDRPILGLSYRLPNITRRDPFDSTRPDREPGFTTHAVSEVLKLGMSVLNTSRRVAPRTQQMAVLVNAYDRTVKEGAVADLARQWAQHGAAVWMYEIPDSLRLAHNIVDPIRGAGGGPMVLQLLKQLINGEPPSSVVRPLPVLPSVPGSPGRK
jgi:esterase/lipase